MSLALVMGRHTSHPFFFLALFISGVLHPLDYFSNTKKVTPCTMADVIKDCDVTDAELKKRGCKK